MARPWKRPFLNPREPVRALTWSMGKARQVHRWTGKQTAQTYGCSESRISRIEQGTMPSRSLVIFYDETFEMDGQLMSLYEVAIEGDEQERRRYGGKRPPPFLRALPGDESTFVDENVPNGQCFSPGEFFTKTWQIRNSGRVPWKGRRLERQGPKTGPGLITSERYYPIPDTEPGQIAEIPVLLKAPTYDSTSIAYFKMVDAEGFLCFPNRYQLGLEVIVRVEGQLPDVEVNIT
jgi:Ig-like domain-containing protein